MEGLIPTPPKLEARIAVVGSRGFRDYPLLRQKVDEFITTHQINPATVIIVSGGAHGADSLAERYADERGYRKEILHAKWSQLGRAAGYARNAEIAKLVSYGIAFWDEQSKGTKQMLRLFREHRCTYDVVHYTRL